MRITPLHAQLLICILLVFHGFHFASCYSTFLVKTSETFKLAELQYLEARLQARDYSCERLVLDVATGCSLLRIDGFDGFAQRKWPSSLRRADWVGEILAQSVDPHSLLTTIGRIQSIQPGWTLDYLRLHQTEADATKSSGYTSRSLMYSSSINPNIAEIIVDFLLDAVDGMEHPKVLDPTCGSGTFLAYALARGMVAEGWDVQQACVDGTKRNLDSFFGKSDRWTVSRRDATDCLTMESMDDVDCVVANLPWGQNTISYVDENSRILESITPFLKEKTPCAFATKDTKLQVSLKRLGYTVLGWANVPPTDFELPRKEAENNSDAASSSRSSVCVITLALSPIHDQWQELL
ncbi:hypothetical protein MHU86_17562 [Fragilaria crotonensis]|nr:hypothetical protein MHU86_17562 [Fragilaria crotonensis]